MTIKSVEFIGKAQEIKSLELSLQSAIEQIQGFIDNLSNRMEILQNQIVNLYGELTAVLNSDNPSEELIASIQAKIEEKEKKLQETSNELEQTDKELDVKQKEYEKVEEEKRQTLFEIQERARTYSSDMSKVSGMYGAWAGIGQSIHQKMQSSFDALAQAATILDSSINSSSGSGGGGRSGTSSHAGIGENNYTRPSTAINGANNISSGGFSSMFLRSSQQTGLHFSNGGLQSSNGRRIGIQSKIYSSRQSSRADYDGTQSNHSVASAVTHPLLFSSSQNKSDTSITNSKTISKTQSLKKNSSNRNRGRHSIDEIQTGTISDKISQATSFEELNNIIKNNGIARSTYWGNCPLDTAKQWSMSIHKARYAGGYMERIIGASPALGITSSVRKEVTAKLLPRIQQAVIRSFGGKVTGNDIDKYHQIVYENLKEQIDRIFESSDEIIAMAICAKRTSKANPMDITVSTDNTLAHQFNGVLLNANENQSLQDIESKLFELEKKGWIPKDCNSLDYVAFHETAHQADAVLGISADPEVIEMFNKYQGYSKDWQKQFLSIYAAENINEFVAEAYAEAMTSPNPRGYAKKIKTKFDEAAKQYLDPKEEGIGSRIRESQGYYHASHPLLFKKAKEKTTSEKVTDTPPDLPNGPSKREIFLSSIKVNVPQPPTFNPKSGSNVDDEGREEREIGDEITR